VSGYSRLEKLGKPGVFAVTDNFARDAKSAAEDFGIPRARMITVPAADYYRLRSSEKEIRPVAEAAVDGLIDGLQRPLIAEEASTAARKEALEPVVVTADSYAHAVQKFNQVFLDKHWGDGLPLVPPTKEAVQEMLQGTSRSPKEVIGTVAPKNGIATIEKIAINSVMAGAKPEYLPVIIAAMEGITDPAYDDLHILTSSGSFNLAIMVSGPIAKELNINAGIGLLGYGWQANSTIGRAVRLITINMGRVWPAENDMALVGRPSSQFYVFAENQELSPWEPFHVTQGFQRDDSCVTISSVMSSPGSNFGGGAVEPWTPQQILDNITRTLLNSRAAMTGWRRGGPNPGPMKHILVFQPEFAIELDRLGYTRVSLQKLLYERAMIPYEQLTPAEISSIQPRIDSGEIPPDRVPLFKDALKQGGRLPILDLPEDIRIVVGGGIPGYTFGMMYYREGLYAPTSDQTRKIRGATLTKAGRN
jgi:hypothetical protein